MTYAMVILTPSPELEFEPEPEPESIASTLKWQLAVVSTMEGAMRAPEQTFTPL